MNTLGDRPAFLENAPVAVLDSDEFADGFRSLFEQSGLCMANLDARLRVREANADFLREVHRRPQDTYDRPFLALLHRSVRSTVEHELTELVAGRRERFTERILAVQPDGTLVPAEMTGIAVADAHRQDRHGARHRHREAPRGRAAVAGHGQGDPAADGRADPRGRGGRGIDRQARLVTVHEPGWSGITGSPLCCG